ncbi:hypothetical protein JB92DRAFT_3133895 [Gautieria morchelliformis]|nr:hypothetical protein JB92DRAFT_3133895 [Gautieria morchelliformis]
MSEDSVRTTQESECLSTEAAQASRHVERVRHEFENNWRQDDIFLEKFFPVCPSWKPYIEVTQKRAYRASASRWKDIPKSPNIASKLYTPLRMLMNDILLAEEESRQRPSSPKKASGLKAAPRKPPYLHDDSWSTKHVRRILATHSQRKRVQNSADSPVSPTLFLAGAGCQILAVSWTTIKAATVSGISPIEIILDSDDFPAARDRLATNMTLMMADQTHRRFAYGLIMTETTCTVYMFDHSGAVASQPFNYHQHPTQFCAVLFGLGSDQGDRIGFDKNFVVDHQHGPLLRTRVDSGNGLPNEVYYSLDDTLFHSPSLVGRGTICWLAVKLEDPHSLFVIKDAWIPRAELSGGESEGSLLRHAESKGIEKGIAQLEHFEEVTRSNDPSDLDTILRNRQVDTPAAEDLKLDRVHTCIVLRTYGKRLELFETRQELLFAFRDAVLAHRELHEVAGILHRDISMGNILINSGGTEGNRGILIDFDHAIRVGDTSLHSTKRKIGTWRFMSRNILEGKNPHTYIDDLESFYFVLCWILMVYSGPDKPKPKTVLPRQAAWWDDEDACAMKGGHLASRVFLLPLDTWFGPSFRALAINLCDFFRLRSLGLTKFVSARKDYDEYLGYIDQCIKAEGWGGNEHLSSPSDRPDGALLPSHHTGNETETQPVPTS